MRVETTKVRKTRHFVVKDWEYFDELFKLLQPPYPKANKDNKKSKIFGGTFVFSAKGTSILIPRAIGYHFNKIVELAEIIDSDIRDLVPYSLRHYFIKDRIKGDATPTQVAEMFGTSMASIKKKFITIKAK